jgi:glutamine amidotransferase
MNIVVIDYGLGNLRSVYNALTFLGANVKVSESPVDIKNAKKLVLPGVGAFRDAMTGLAQRGLIEPLKASLAAGKPYLGICLGQQLLFEKSEEGRIDGLGILKGRVARFQEKDGIKVPHIGWNNVDCRPETRNMRLFKGVKDKAYFYFDHSYYVDPEEKEIIAATTDYGIAFASYTERENIFAAQFHPERSQALGLKMLKNFIDL